MGAPWRSQASGARRRSWSRPPGPCDATKDAARGVLGPLPPQPLRRRAHVSEDEVSTSRPRGLAEPYPPGNLAALKHGARSERVIAARAEVVHAKVLEVAPWLDEPEYAPAVARYLRAEARALLLHEHITHVAQERGAGRVSQRLWEQATAADRLAAQLGSVLGLDPLGKAKLRAVASAAELNLESLSQLAARGERIRQDAEERLALGVAGD